MAFCSRPFQRRHKLCRNRNARGRFATRGKRECFARGYRACKH